MLEIFNKNKIFISAALILVVLNVAAYFFIKESISIVDALQQVEDDAVRSSLQNEGLFYNLFSAVVLTLDIAAGLFLLYLLHKLLFKTLKNALPKKP